MPSTFFGLNIAASGLRAANAALNTTANNISNANTTGYSKQEVITQAADALRVFTTYGSAGAGVDTLSIERVRDSFYDSKYRNNQELLGDAEIKNYYNKVIEEYYHDDGTTGFSTVFSSMRASLQSAMTDAEASETKATFISKVQTVADYFNTINQQLEGMQQDLNDELKLCCETITSYAQEIATLNQQIDTIILQGGQPNDLKDKRDKIVDDLSKLVDVDIKEYDVIDENDPERDTGLTHYSVSISGGQLLVDGYNYKKLIVVAREEEEKVNQSDIDGLYDIYWGTSSWKDGDDSSFLSDFKMDSKLIGGELQSIIEMRDGNNGYYFNGEVMSTEKLSTGDFEVTIQVSDTKLMDMNKCVLPECGKLNVSNKIYSFSSWSYDGGDTYKFVLTADSCKTSTPANGRTAKVGSNYDYQGLPYYMIQMNEFIRTFSNEVNEIMVNGYTKDGENGVYMLTGTTSTDSTAQYSYEDLTTLSENKGYYNVTAKNFVVNSVLSDNADMLATKADITEGESEFLNLDALYEMMTNKNIFRGATSGEFLDKILADVGLNASNAKTLEEMYTSLENTIGNERLSISGVDSDEEAAALVQYQNSYTLNSKMIQTLTEIYDRLILETGV